MVFDPGTNSWGMGFGQGFGGGGNFGGGGRMPRVPRAMPNRMTQPGYTAFDPTGASMWSAIYAAKGDQYQQQGDLWQQSLEERQMALQNKYDMQKLQMQLDSQRQNAMMQLMAQGMALPTGEQIERSRGDLQGSLDDYTKMRDQGRYSQDEMNLLGQNAWNAINTGAMNDARAMNSQLSAMGLSSNPGAAAALGLQGRFAANAERGNVMAGLTRENKEAMERGVAGRSGVLSQMADYASRPINRTASPEFLRFFGIEGDEDPRRRNKNQSPDGWRYGNTQRPTPQRRPQGSM